MACCVVDDASSPSVSVHGVTLAFDDPSMEQAFRVEQARNSLSVGFFGNAVLLACIFGIVQSWPSVGALCSMWKVAFPPAAMSIVGLLSSVPFHRRRGAREHSLLYLIGIPNVLIGSVLWVAGILSTEFEISDISWFCLCGVIGLVAVAAHMLAFPFWARCCTMPTLVVADTVIAVYHAPISTLRSSAKELSVCIGAALVGEVLGYILHRAARAQYLKVVQLEAAQQQQMMEVRRLAARTEQLQGEKERIELERQMLAQKAARSPSRFRGGRSPSLSAGSTTGSNDELAGILPQRTPGPMGSASPAEKQAVGEGHAPELAASLVQRHHAVRQMLPVSTELRDLAGGPSARTRAASSPALTRRR